MFKKIFTHERPHLDEIAAIWLLKKFGKEKFPGIEGASIEIRDKITRSAEEYEKEGILLIGIGGGKFDEHGTNGNRTKSNECATTLVARCLGIDNDPALQQILKAVVNADTKGISWPLDLSTLTKDLHDQFPDDPQIVIDWVVKGLEAKYRAQIEFWGKAKEDFEKKAEIEEINTAKGSIKLVTIISDSSQVSKYARGQGAGIIIQKRSTGNVQIYVNKRARLNMQEVIVILRVEELRAKRKMIPPDWKILTREGIIPGVEEWYYQKEAELILNGSLTATNVLPTKLSLEQIKRAVKIGVNPALLMKHCAESGVCKKECSWFDYSLPRCRDLRSKKKR